MFKVKNKETGTKPMAVLNTFMAPIEIIAWLIEILTS